jgi:hypothetical protein
MTPKTCSLRILPSGVIVAKTTDELKREILADEVMGLAARFFSVRDTSADSQDIARDPDPKRRQRAYSLTRDAIEGPGGAEYVQALDGDSLRRPSRPASVDQQRFLNEAVRLQSLGVIALDAKLGDVFESDENICRFFDRVRSVVHDPKLSMAKRKQIVDSAPSIYVFTELLKQTAVLIEEELTELWARRIFPINNLNTWLPQWSYKRYGRRGMMPQYVDMEFTPSAANQQSERVHPVVRPIVFFDNGASWNLLELERHAEAVANGATKIALDRDRIDTARRMMLMKENLLAFFGDPEVDIHGLFSPEADTGIERITSLGTFPTGDTETDRTTLTNTVKQIIANTENALQPNTVMLSTLTWLYINDKRYGSVAADSNQTVAEAALATLNKLGVSEFLWVPEVGYSATQKTRLQAHGIASAEAGRLAGGLNEKQTMVVCRRDPAVMELIVGKDLVLYPARETVQNRVEVRMLQGSGGMTFYRPEGVKIVEDIGPDTVT